MNVLIVYLSVCSLAGLVISKDDDVNQYRNEHEKVRGWEKLFGGMSGADGFADETVPEFPNNTRSNNSNMTTGFGNGLQQAGNGNNGSEGYQIDIRNGSGIPEELFFRWWSVVRPFGNEMDTEPKFPWAVAVQSKRGRPNSHSCSGNILTKRYVLSTCRCLSNPTGSAVMPLTPKDPSLITIVAGVSMLNIPLKEQLFYGQIRNAVGIDIHPHCSLAQKFDYGVIELEYYFYFTNRVLPIPDPFETLKSKTSGNGFLIKESEICQAAGWPLPLTVWDGEPKDEQKVKDFMVLREESCFPTRSENGNQLVCTKVVNEDPRTSPYAQSSGDVGSGLMCHNKVTAILSYHVDGYAVFSSLRPALSFLWQYYQDQTEIYTMSSSLIPAVSTILLVFTFHVPAISTYN